MGSHRSKEDEVQKISTSVFVTNFPDHVTAKDLWNTCKQYGYIVDAFIPNRRSKGGAHKDKGLNESTNSYAHVVKGSKPQYVVSENIPALTLDDSCLNQQNYTCCLMGKDASFSNLKMVLANEGFNNIELRYMGGYWIQQASNDFMVDERVVWVELEGIPLNLWSENTFKSIASKWGSLIHVDEQEHGSLYSKRVCINTNVSANIFESFKIIYRGDELKNDTELEGDSDAEVVPDTKFDDVILNAEEPSVGHNEMRSKDPFNLYELLNKKKEDNNTEASVKDSLKYRPGFTPRNKKSAPEEHIKNHAGECSHTIQEEDAVSEPKDSHSNEKFKDDVAESICSGHFKKSDIPRTGGSFLHVMEELVNVGHTMGYNMKGCMKNIEEIIESQGETKMENMDLFCIKRCWGNFAFDYVHSDSVGNSGGILCVWDPKTFIKLNATVSDYFVIVRGDWVPNGDVIVMGDFNEIRKKDERFGSVFNVQGADAFNLFITKAGLEEVPLGGCSFTWFHKSASKMSKLDRFLISESLMSG
ncbi:RNA-directed DNA polymerase, eukaryota, reverse transcriptase zinc-binding domain protein [Tanacetum coccineum]